MMIQAVTGGVRIAIRLSPRAGRDCVVGVHGDAIRVAIAAPPLDGRANASLIRLLAKTLGLRKGDLRITMGSHGRDKVVQALGIDPVCARARLGLKAEDSVDRDG